MRPFGRPPLKFHPNKGSKCLSASHWCYSFFFFVVDYAATASLLLGPSVSFNKVQTLPKGLHLLCLRWRQRRSTKRQYTSMRLHVSCVFCLPLTWRGFLENTPSLSS